MSFNICFSFKHALLVEVFGPVRWVRGEEELLSQASPKQALTEGPHGPGSDSEL